MAGMCLIVFNFAPGLDGHLSLAANRDEFHERPTQPMAWWRWPHGPLAGRDLRGGGTWLALGRDGRWAAVTNFRDPGALGGERSRGELPVRFLASQAAPEAFVRVVHAERRLYGPFNVLAGDRSSLWYVASRTEPAAVSPGVHALSNGLLDEPWPKSRRAAAALEGLEGSESLDPERLFSLMDDREAASDDELPETGVGVELERFLSPPFIVGERYGTRCTTVVSLGKRCRVAERGFDRQGATVSALEYVFDSGDGVQ